MQRIAVVADLKPGTVDEARKVIAAGPPFDPEELGFERHAVYVTDRNVVFVIEGGNLDMLVGTMTRRPQLAQAFAAWEPLLEGMPRVATREFFWERDVHPAWVGSWGE